MRRFILLVWGLSTILSLSSTALFAAEGEYIIRDRPYIKEDSLLVRVVHRKGGRDYGLFASGFMSGETPVEAVRLLIKTDFGSLALRVPNPRKEFNLLWWAQQAPPQSNSRKGNSSEDEEIKSAIYKHYANVSKESYENSFYIRALQSGAYTYNIESVSIPGSARLSQSSDLADGKVVQTLNYSLRERDDYQGFDGNLLVKPFGLSFEHFLRGKSDLEILNMWVNKNSEFIVALGASRYVEKVLEGQQFYFGNLNLNTVLPILSKIDNYAWKSYGPYESVELSLLDVDLKPHARAELNKDSGDLRIRKESRTSTFAPASRAQLESLRDRLKAGRIEFEKLPDVHELLYTLKSPDYPEIYHLVRRKFWPSPESYKLYSETADGRFDLIPISYVEFGDKRKEVSSSLGTLIIDKDTAYLKPKDAKEVPLDILHYAEVTEARRDALNLSSRSRPFDICRRLLSLGPKVDF